LNDLPISNRYKATYRDFADNYGFSILAEHKTVSNAIMSIYSDHKFLLWLFNKLPNNFFDSEMNRSQYLEWLKAKLGVREIRDIRAKDLKENHGRAFLVKYGKVYGIIDPKKNPSKSELEKPKRFERPKNYWVPFAFLFKFQRILRSFPCSFRLRTKKLS